MSKYFLFIVSFFIANIAAAEEQALNVQAQLQSEYGNCYNKFQNDLAICNPATCNYPDLTDAKAWRTHVIRGPVNDTCYVIYYSYIESNIVGTPIHCYYQRSQVDSLSTLYTQLFKANDMVQATDLQGKINQIVYNHCKTENAQTDNSGSATK